MWNSKIWKRVIIILATIAAAVLIAGGYCYYSFEYPGDPLVCMWMTLQNCMESLLFNPILTIQDIVSNNDFMTSAGSGVRMIMTMYSLAMVLAPFVDILIIFSVLDSFLHLFAGAGFKERRILIVGYNDKVQRVIERKNENGKVFLWTENFLSADDERDLYLKKVSVKMNEFSLGDSQDEYQSRKNKYNRFIKRKRITDILLLNESDTKNIQYYMALSSCDICRQKTIHFYVLNKSFEARNMLQNYFDSKLKERVLELKAAAQKDETQTDSAQEVVAQTATVQEDATTKENAAQTTTAQEDVAQTDTTQEVDVQEDVAQKATVQETAAQKNTASKAKEQDTHMDMRIINYDQIQAEELFSRMPIYTGKEASDDKNVHLLIIGGDSLSMYTALSAMNQAVFSVDNKIVIDIIDDHVDDIRSRLRERFDKTLVDENGNAFSISSDKIDGFIKIRLFDYNLMDSNLSSAFSELQDEESGAFTYISLCSKNIDENLHVFRCIDSADLITSGRSVPVAMRMSFSEEMEAYLSSFKWCGKLFFMGENEEYIGIDQIVNLDEEKYIRAYNATYAAVANSRIFKEDSKLNEEDKKEIKWNKLEYYQRQANRALYHHKKTKELFFTGYEDEMRRFWQETAPGSEVEKDRALSDRLIIKDKYPKLVEMAKTEHRRWAYFYASEGWGYSAKKVPVKRLHDCLCNWERLEKLKPSALIYDLISTPLLMKSKEDGEKSY